jgi:hypothetical protein
MDDEVVYFDFRRKARKSAPRTQVTSFNIPEFAEDLNELINIFEEASDIKSLDISEEIQNQIEFLSFMCDKFAEECHRLGFDVAPDIEVTVELEKEDD